MDAAWTLLKVGDLNVIAAIMTCAKSAIETISTNTIVSKQ